MSVPNPAWANPNATQTPTHLPGHPPPSSAAPHHINGVATAVSAAGPPGSMTPGGMHGGMHGGMGGPPGTGAPVPDSYFTESRKGEVNELRNLLRNFTVERDQKKKREIIKKVIAYMTLGIDVSRLFTEMMLAIETRDLVIKKMVYLFLCNYAQSNPELAQMCTNTLQKDCGNDDPMVRGLALRSLCSLRLPQMVEYIHEPLRRSLTDTHAYVRKTGVMGTLKMYHLDQEAFENSNFVDILYDMLRDPDASVVSNCILVLNEIMASGDNGGMAINRAIMLHLLNRIHEFSDFGVLAVLELVPRYVPANDEEGYQIMNLLDPVLRTNNAGAFVATVRAFLSLAESIGGNDVESMRRQVVGRIRAPLVTQVAGGPPEQVYCLLRHVDSLVELCPGIFDDEYRQFYVRYTEPSHIKYLKIAILPKLANPDNAPDIVAELGEYAKDADELMGRSAIRSMARIAVRDVGGEGSVPSIARRLVDLLDLDIGHIASEAASALVDVMRKHPDMMTLIAPPLPRAVKYVSEPKGKAALVHLLGECGEVVPEAPYSLEKLIDQYDDIDDAGVKIALLESTMKLLFKRAPEVQRMLGRLLSKATEDVSNQDLHDRALLYYRLLRSSADPRTVEKVVVTSHSLPVATLFSEDDDKEVREELMKEFDSLSIVYGAKSENFIAKEFQVKFVRMPAEHPLESAAPVVDPGVNEVAGQMQEANLLGDTPVPATNGTASAPAPAPAAPASDGVMDLLGFSDPVPAPAAAAPAASLELDPSVTLSGEEYQSKWGAVADSEAITVTIPLKALPPSTDAVEGPLGAAALTTMASGDLPTELKFFLYAKEKAGSMALFLAQASISKDPTNLSMSMTVKCSGGDPGSNKDKVGNLETIVRSALSAYV
eukprot:CAMPEP_0178486214 /NCGR_PEP_ID=MMETSP0696-20121128/8692_1 /TAXON_ID=265572 /ORGANISM="Extubocellulus spinifer, Strain CCMP396" /LENGTH=884 /DNA_ID=CAMNT_0020113871 /DNA_START=200 /DNA_END=2854 /DNA_ORIENTATION=+